MTQRFAIAAATALWATSITMVGFGFAIHGIEGMFELANMVALMACVPTFYLIAEVLFARHMRCVSRDHRELLGDVLEVVGRADAERDLRQIHRR